MQWACCCFALMLWLAAVHAHAQSEAGSETVRWDFPTAYPEQNFHTENILQFVSEVELATEGRLRIKVFPNAALFSATEIKYAVQGGQAQIGEILLANLQNESVLFGIDGIPFLATSYADARQLYRASKAAHDRLLAGHGLLMLFSVPWPPQGIYSRKEISTPDDMNGLKWRAYSRSTIRIAELVQAHPVVVQASGLSAALKSGGVEAFMSSSSTGYDIKSQEHLKYFYDLRASLPRNAVIVNRSSFQALDQRTREAVLKAAANAEARGWKLSEEKNQWYLEQLQRSGIRISQPSPRLRAGLEQVGAVMLSDWLKQSGAAGQAILGTYRGR